MFSKIKAKIKAKIKDIRINRLLNMNVSLWNYNTKPDGTYDWNNSFCKLKELRKEEIDWWLEYEGYKKSLQ